MTNLSRSGATLLAVWTCLGCGPSEPSFVPPSNTPSARVSIGLSGGTDGLEFEALAEGGSIPLHTFGQGGQHALLAIRCEGLGNRAFIDLTVTNERTAATVNTPPSTSPRLLLCRDDTTCDWLPVLLVLSGLTEPGESREGLPVELQATAWNQTGQEVTASARGVLTQAPP